MTVRVVVTTRVQILDGADVLLDVAGAYDRAVPRRGGPRGLRNDVSVGLVLADQDVRAQLGQALCAAGLDPA